MSQPGRSCYHSIAAWRLPRHGDFGARAMVTSLPWTRPTEKLLWDVWVAGQPQRILAAAARFVFDGKVFIGEAGADIGVNGHVYAFDAATGRRPLDF